MGFRGERRGPHRLDDCMADDFGRFIIHRAGKILDAIENATGKIISGRDNEEVIEKFGDKI